MLTFFRKYQKIVFLFTAIITIISFAFFGTQNSMGSSLKEAPNRHLVKSLDGTWISERDVKGLAYLLDSISGLSAGFLEKDLFATGLGDILAERYFANFKGDLEERLKKVKGYKPYTHPQAPFVSATGVWAHFSPEIMQVLSQIQAKAESSPETLKLLIKLYGAQAEFSPEMLKRVLFYQQQQLSWVTLDQNLIREDLSLFHFKSLEDWFGTQFCYMVSEVILNVAAYAEQKGYRVNKKEALSHLLHNSCETLKTYGDKEKISSLELEQHLARVFQSAGLDQNQGIDLWRKVLLFKRLFDEVGGSLFLDPLVHKEFNSFACEKASLNLFQLPPECRLKDFRSMLKLQVYLESVAPKSNKGDIPTQFLSIEEIEKICPELVQRVYDLELIHVKKRDLLQEVSLKATWDWELEEANWNILKKEFPILARTHLDKREERFHLLEEIDPAIRLKIDTFVQGQIVDAHPEWLENAFQNNKPTKMKVGIRLEEESFPLEGIEDPAIFHACLQDAPLKSEDPEPYSALHSLSQDRENYYRIWVLEKPFQREVLTFKEANDEGLLDRLLQKRLAVAYPDIRKKEASRFQQADGSWRPLNEVQDLVGAKLYSDLLRVIDDKYNLLKKSEEGLDFYAHYRFYPFMSKIKSSLETNPLSSDWFHQEGNVDLASQWKLIKIQKEVGRSVNPEVFDMDLDQFSDIDAGLHGDINFCQLIGRRIEEKDLVEQVEKEQKLLAKEACKDLMQQILNLIAKKNAIDLSYLISDTHE